MTGTCNLCGEGLITPRTESVHTKYLGKKGVVTLRYVECDSCGSEITGDDDGRDNKLSILEFRSMIDCDPATGNSGLVCAQTSCDEFLTTDRNQPIKESDLESA